MIQKIVDFALAQRLLVLTAALAMVGVGYQSARTLPVDAFPDVSPVLVPHWPALVPSSVPDFRQG